MAQEIEKVILRQCAKCGHVIQECMGFVKAGDMLEGKELPRELCGKCVMSWEWNEAGELIPSVSIFLDVLYVKQHYNQDDVTDWIFEGIDDLLTNNDFERCDKILRDINIPDLNSKSIRSLLTICHPAKEKLPTWQAFFAGAEQRLLELRGEEITNRLISRFR